MTDLKCVGYLDENSMPKVHIMGSEDDYNNFIKNHEDDIQIKFQESLYTVHEDYVGLNNFRLGEEEEVEFIDAIVFISPTFEVKVFGAQSIDKNGNNVIYDVEESNIDMDSLVDRISDNCIKNFHEYSYQLKDELKSNVQDTIEGTEGTYGWCKHNDMEEMALFLYNLPSQYHQSYITIFAFMIYHGLA